jgi:hypothetical protein
VDPDIYRGGGVTKWRRGWSRCGLVGSLDLGSYTLARDASRVATSFVPRLVRYSTLLEIEPSRVRTIVELRVCEGETVCQLVTSPSIYLTRLRLIDYLLIPGYVSPVNDAIDEYIQQTVKQLKDYSVEAGKQGLT